MYYKMCSKSILVKRIISFCLWIKGFLFYNHTFLPHSLHIKPIFLKYVNLTPQLLHINIPKLYTRTHTHLFYTSSKIIYVCMWGRKEHLYFFSVYVKATYNMVYIYLTPPVPILTKMKKENLTQKYFGFVFSEKKNKIYMRFDGSGHTFTYKYVLCVWVEILEYKSNRQTLIYINKLCI